MVEVRRTFWMLIVPAFQGSGEIGISSPAASMMGTWPLLDAADETSTGRTALIIADGHPTLVPTRP